MRKNKKRIIIALLAICAALFLALLLFMPQKTLTLDEMFAINGQSYTARFMYQGEWYDFSESQYAAFSSHLDDTLERFLELPAGHFNTGDFITIEVSCADGTVTTHTLVSELLRYSDYVSYVPSDTLLEFLKCLPKTTEG